MDVKNILISAQNPDDNIRKWAEFYLEELEKKNIQEFFINLSNILGEENIEPHIRRLAGLVLKNKLEIKEETGKNSKFYKWLSLIEKITRENIKSLILKVFRSPSKIARRTASQILAKITSIELANEEPNNILDFFSKILEKDFEDLNLYHAIIETVEFICQETGSEKFPESIYKKYSIQIIKIILEAINKGDYNCIDIKISALNGFLSSVEFIEEIFFNPYYRNFIFKTISEQLKNSNISIRALSFEILDKVAQNYYCYLENYIPLFFEITINTIKNDDDTVVLQAIEFWSTVADEEFDINMETFQALNEGKFFSFYSGNFISKTSSYLPDLLLNFIKNRNKTERMDEWNCCTAAASCLNLMSQASPCEIIYPTIFFIENNISNNVLNVEIEYITLIFVSIFDGIGSKVLYGYVRKMLDFWFKYVEKNSVNNQDIINLTIGKISHHFPCMIRYYLDRIVQIILFNLINKINIQNSYWSLNEILQSFGKEGIVDWCFEYIISAIINKILCKSTINKFAGELFEVFSSLIINSNIRNKHFIYVVIPFFLSNFSLYVFQKEDNFLKDNKDIQKYLCRIIGYFIQRYGENINIFFIEKIIKLLFHIINEIKNNCSNCVVEEEILACFGAIIQIPKTKNSLKAKEIVNFLIRCIKNTENIQNCSLAIGIVGDLCRTIESELKPFIDKILEILIICIKKNNIDKKLIPPLITCIGDIMLTYGFKIKHFNNLIDLFKKIVTTSKELHLDKDTEHLELNFRIKESILESITGIIQGYQEKKDVFIKEKLLDRLKWVTNYIYDTISKDRIFRIVKICIGLIGDIAICFEVIKNIIKDEVWIFQLLYESKNNKEDKNKILGSWAFNSVY